MELSTLTNLTEQATSEIKHLTITELKVLATTLGINGDVKGDKKLKKNWLDAVITYKVNNLMQSEQFVEKDGKIFLSESEKESQLRYDVLRTVKEIARKSTVNYVGIYVIAKELPTYTLQQIHSALLSGESEDVYELSAVAETKAYTNEQLECGIRQLNCNLLFVSLNNFADAGDGLIIDWDNDTLF